VQGGQRRGEPARAAAPAAGQRHVGAHDARRPATQPAQQTAGATGEVASLSVGVPAGSAPIPTTTIPVPGMGNVDITQALAALLPPPPNPLLGVKLSSATASASCVNGKPALTGSSHVLGLTVAGQELPVDQAVSQASRRSAAGRSIPRS
jgi:hypothetical protein